MGPRGVRLPAWVSSPAFLAGAAVVVTGGVALAATRRSSSKTSEFRAATERALSAAAELSPGASAVLRGRSAQVMKQAGGLDPYSLVSATAMCRTILGWAGKSGTAQQLGLIARGQEQVRSILSSADLSEREKVRALVLGVAYPFLVSSDGNTFAVQTSDFHSELRIPMLYAYANAATPGGTDLQQARIMQALIWCGMYVLAPGTSCVKRGADLGVLDSALPVGPVIGGAASASFDLPLSTWRDAAWELAPSSDQRWRAMLDLFWHVTFWPASLLLSTGIEDKYGCAQYEPNPCIQLSEWDDLLYGIISDARELSSVAAGKTPVPGLNPAAVEGANQATLQLCARALLQQTQPRTVIPPPDNDPFAIVMTAIGVAISAVATVFSAGAASGILAASVASTFALVSGAATSAIALAQAVHGAPSVGSAVHAVMASSLGQVMVEKASLLLPPDLAAAGQLVANVAKKPDAVLSSLMVPPRPW